MMNLSTPVPPPRSMRRDIARRLLTSLLAVLAAVSAIALLALMHLNAQSAQRRLDDAVTHFMARVALTEGEWEVQANIFRQQLALSGIASATDPRTVRTRFAALAGVFGGSGLFSRAALLDGSGRVLADFRNTRADARDDALGDDAPWRLSPLDGRLYRVLSMPVQLASGAARLVLHVPLDDALLALNVFPDTRIALRWAGRVVAQSAAPQTVGTRDIFGMRRDFEVQRIVPWDPRRPGPQMEIDARIIPPASTADVLVFIVVTMIAIGGIGWWLMGHWLGAQSRRLGRLGKAAAGFAASQRLDAQVELALAEARAARTDEIAGLVDGVSAMMGQIEAGRTEQLRARQALEAQRALNLKIIETSPIGICIYDTEGDCIQANDAMARQVGGTLQQILAQNFRRIASWRSCGLDALAQRALGGEQVVSDIIEMTTSFGKKAWYGVTLCALREERGPWLMLMINDITDIKRAEQALVLSERKYRTLVEQAADAIFVADRDGRFLEINDMGVHMLGYTREALLGRSLDTVIADGGTTAFGLRALRQRGAVRREGRLRRRDGTTLVAEVSVRLTPSGDMVGIVRDITARKAMENQLVELNATLERKVTERTAELAGANAELEAFAYAVSHDLRAPLRAIDGYGRLLQESAGAKLGADARGYLERLRAGTRRMAVLIDDLLKLSRVTLGAPSRGEVNLSTMANEVVADLQRVDPVRAAEVSVQPGMRVTADPGLMRVVFENLIGNAWKYTRHTPRARIEIGGMPLADGGIEVFVRDNGAGFDPAYAGKLFQPFQRLHPTSEFEGSGIGLATVARIVKRHRGSLRATGEIGRGASFHIMLPEGSVERDARV